jgi:hypothetical protein
MKLNLDTLRTEIQEHLVGEGFAIFYGYSRITDSQPLVFWDCQRLPDYKMFVQTGRAAGAKLMVFHQRELTPDLIDDALERVECCELAPEERRNVERRLNDLRAYEGFICALELSFDHEGRVYVFDLRSEWYQELADLLDDLDLLDAEDDDDEDGDSMSSYFSKN